MVEIVTPTVHLGICNDFQQLIKSKRIFKSKLHPLSSQITIYSSNRIVQEHTTGVKYTQDQIIHSAKYQKVEPFRIPFMKKTLGIFLESNEQLQVAKKKLDVVAEISKLYIKKIRSFTSELSGNDAALFSAIHGIFQLAHIICFNHSTSKNPLLAPLTEWVQLNYPSRVISDYQLLENHPEPSSNPQFWPTIFSCILRGYLDGAKALLSRIPVDEKVVRVAIDQLASYPDINSMATTKEFGNAWFLWKQNSKSYYSTLSSLISNSVHEQHFKTLFAILAGEEEIILNISNDWHDTLIAFMHFVSPLHDSRTISELVQVFKTSVDEENILDQIQIAILEQNIGLTLVLCSQFDWWLVTHLVHLMEHSGLLNPQETLDDISLSEWYIHGYSEYVISCPELWLVALEYLRFCPTFGKSTLELLIPRIKLNNANDFEKMIMFCKNNGLQLALKSVLLTQGMNAYNAQLYTEAITCYIEAGEYSRINHIVYKLLGMYQTNGNIAYKDAISGIPMESLFKSPILSFLFRFIEFQTLYKEKNYGEAADLVVLLLTSGIAPKSFWKMLLLDALPLLEGQINVFTSEQVMELMRCVESCMSDSRDHPTLLKQDDESLNVLKLALNRSFAAALVCGK